MVHEGYPGRWGAASDHRSRTAFGPRLTSGPEPADTPGVANIYDVAHVNGDIYEIDADFFQREGDDWAFYSGPDEVFRVSWLDVLSVSKSSTRPAPAEEPSEQVWI